MHLSHTLFSLLLACGLGVGMLLTLEAGRHLGRRRLSRDPEGARAGLGAVEGSVFGLLGLLVAFTFNGAANRFDQRRDLIVQEANAIDTAWTRLDLLPSPARAGLQELFRRYLDARLEAYRRRPDIDAANLAFADANALQKAIWQAAIAAANSEQGASLRSALLPALNQMFDIATTRRMALSHHPPQVIFGLLFLLSLGCSLLAGYAMAPGRERSWAHMAGFAFLIAVSVYVILDLEFPRRGLIQVTGADQVLKELRETMK